MSLTIICYPYGPLGENTYLVTDDDTGLKAVIDPGYIGKDVMDAIGDKSSLKYVLLTHGHADHILGARDLQKAGLPIYASEVPAPLH